MVFEDWLCKLLSIDYYLIAGMNSSKPTGNDRSLKRKRASNVDELEGEKRLAREKLMTFANQIAAAVNDADIQRLLELLKDNCNNDIIIRSDHLKDAIMGIHSILLMSTILHRCYPDALLEVLEGRTVNLTSPTAMSIKTETDSSSTSTFATQERIEVKLKFELIFKFTGTLISLVSPELLFHEFLSTLDLSSRDPSSIGSDTFKDRMTALGAMKMEEISTQFSVFAKDKLVVPPSNDKTGATATVFTSSYIVEMLLTYHPQTQKILVVQMSFLAMGGPLTEAK